MNAMVQTRDEPPVLTNEMIEVHLSYLRAGVDAVQAAVPVLRDKIDNLSETVNSKTEALDNKIDSEVKALDRKIDSKAEALDKKIDSKFEVLDKKIDSKVGVLEQKMEARFEKVESKIEVVDKKVDKLAEGLAAVQAQMKVLLWVFSSGTVIGVSVWVWKALQWI
jgi:chromosome segregation ATPase